MFFPALGIVTSQSGVVGNLVQYLEVAIWNLIRQW